MWRSTQIALLIATVLVGGLVFGTTISRADVPNPTTKEPTAVMGLMAMGGALVVALVGSQNALRMRQTSRHWELDRLQDEFIQNVAHELRTPLTLVRGYVEMLAEERLDEETRRRAAAVARAKTEALVELVEAITTLHEVKLDDLDSQPVDLAALARTAAKMVQQKAHRAGVRMLLHIPSDLPRITGDSRHLIEALRQLLDNAIKFSPDGGTVTLRLSAGGDNVRVQIADQGIGIPAGKLKRIFDRFCQVDGSTTRRFGGLGLGLAIAKAIIEAHDGRVWASSAGAGRGSTFVFTVPMRATSPLPVPHSVLARGKHAYEARCR
jgi:signal transduction histidine kinase